MSKPSLSEFKAKPQEMASETAKPIKDGEEIKGITLRLKRSQWQNMVAMTTSEGIKIQPFILALIEAEFEKRGLRF